MQAICCHSEVEPPVWNSIQSVVEVVVYVGVDILCYWLHCIGRWYTRGVWWV